MNQVVNTVEPAGEGQQNELHYALIVGINRYPRIVDLRGRARDLRAASRDAKDFYDWLRARNGGDVPDKNIAFVNQDPESFDPRHPEPSRQRVNDELEALIEALKRKLKQDPNQWERSRLYVYVSGHGIAPHAREAALLMANASLNASGESLAARLYLEYFQDTQQFRELVFFADCCRTERARAEISGPPWDRVPGRYGPVSTVLGFATEFGELAYEPTAEEEPDADAARGYFTRALIEGLKGAATEDGWVDSKGLEKFVRRRVSELTAHKKRCQEAPFIVQVTNPIRFCRAVEPSWPVTIEFPDDFAGAVELYRDAAQLVGQWDARKGPWRISLPKYSYEVRPAGAEDGTYWKGDGLFRVLGDARVVRLERSNGHA